MSQFSGSDWISALTKIMEELEDLEYKKMMEYLDKIPRRLKTTRSRVKMPHIIVKYYGEQESVKVINTVMDEIPRRDAAVQDLLRPFVDVLEDQKKGRKRKFVDENQESPVQRKPRTGTARGKLESAAGFRNNNVVVDSETGEPMEAELQLQSSFRLDDEEDPQSLQSDKEKKIPAWRNSIKHLKGGANTKNKPIAGKVVRTSALRTYKTKAKQKKFFFYLGVADETDFIKVMVYGKELYPSFQQGHVYLFRDVIMEDKIMKVTQKTKTSKTSLIDVPNDLELEAQMLIYRQSPLYSVDEAKNVEEATLVSVEGPVTEVYSPKLVKVKGQRRKKKTQRFEVEDETGDVEVTLWGDDIEQFRGISVGDVIRVNNVKTRRYYDTVSLNSTHFTRISKVHCAAVQNVSVEIIGIKSAGKDNTELDAEINSQVTSFVVESALLAKVFGLRHGRDFEERLLEKIPFPAEAEIQGNKIKQLSARTEP